MKLAQSSFDLAQSVKLAQSSFDLAQSVKLAQSSLDLALRVLQSGKVPIDGNEVNL